MTDEQKIHDATRRLKGKLLIHVVEGDPADTQQTCVRCGKVLDKEWMRNLDDGERWTTVEDATKRGAGPGAVLCSPGEGM